MSSFWSESLSTFGGYVGVIRNVVPGSETFYNLSNGVETGTYPGIVAYLQSSSTVNTWVDLRRTLLYCYISGKIPSTTLWRITDFKVVIDLDSKSNSGGMWSDANAGIGIFNASEASLNGFLPPGGDRYTAAGGWLAYSNLIPYSTINAAGYNVFTFNSTGLSYLNQVYSKAWYQGTAFFSFCLVGDAQYYVPTYVYPGTIYTFGYTPANSYYQLTIERPVVANIGNVWRDIEEVKVNIGDTWRTVSPGTDHRDQPIDMNIGDTWKDF
jgi:hypothetical protein